MKKMMFAAVMALACAAQADFTWSNWWGAPDLSNEAKRGCVLGFASDVDTVTGAQVSAIMSRAKKVTCGCQFAIGYSNVGSLRNGCQLAVVNIADNAALQFGLVCKNKGGFLPWFVFFNFDKTAFGAVK